MNLGEVLGVAVNSKGRIASSTIRAARTGPLYGNASTQLLEFDATGKFVREIGKSVYGLGYGHGIRFDQYDNLWVVDKGTQAVRFNPAGYVTMNLGRRSEGPDEPDYFRPVGRGGTAPAHVDGYFGGPTDVAWDSDDNIYISDGYRNSRVAKFDKNGNWVKSWGVARPRRPARQREPGAVQHAAQHRASIARTTSTSPTATTAASRCSIATATSCGSSSSTPPTTRSGIRCSATCRPTAPDETQPWTICITNTPTQYLYTSDEEPGRIYKMTLDGKILGTLGKSGREVEAVQLDSRPGVPVGERAPRRRHEQLARAEGDAASRADRPFHCQQPLTADTMAGVPLLSRCVAYFVLLSVCSGTRARSGYGRPVPPVHSWDAVVR